MANNAELEEFEFRARLERETAKPQGIIDYIKKDLAAIPERAGNLVAGGIRGAGSIGATILAPYDMAKDAIDGKGLSLESNRERRAGMDDGFRSMGVDTESAQYGAGKLGGEIAGTAGIGGMLANGVRLVSQAPQALSFANALASGGFKAGGTPGYLNMLTRGAGGAVTGGATAAAVDPQHAGTGALIGGALPLGAKAAGVAGNYISKNMEGGANRLMQSSIKPTIAQLRTGDADTAVKTLLERGINPTAAGVKKLRALIEGVDDQISSSIGNSTATVSKQKVIDSLDGLSGRFTNQVSPTSDLNAIRGVADDFMAHPNLPGDSIPVQTAQQLKQGTYKALSKKYGQLGSAETEAQKALARGLKEEIATAVPGIQGLNAEQSKLITTLKVTERRALMELNKNPGGLSLLANSPKQWALFMADKSALFKSLAARMLKSTSSGAAKSVGLLANSAPSPVLRSALTRASALSNEGSP